MPNGPGNKRSPEDIAEEIINSTDEGVDDLLEGTEVFDEEDTLSLDEILDTADEPISLIDTDLDDTLLADNNLVDDDSNY